MGLLLHARTGHIVTLVARSLVGRAPSCAVRIEDRRASAEHAVISWDGEHWEARDLGSLNGTWVDDKRVPSGERVPLRRGARLGFGVEGDPWILADARGAGPAARNEATSEIVHATSGLLALPSALDPRATVFRGDDGQWQIEVQGVARPIGDRERVVLDPAEWTLFLPATLEPVPGTWKTEGAPATIDDVEVSFTVSSDEEHVDMVVRGKGGTEMPLPARSSHYTLLTLARARLEDAGRGVAEEEQGWLYASDLAESLGYGSERLNVEIFRARASFAKLGIVDAARLVERRASSRQLRIGVRRVSVRR